MGSWSHLGVYVRSFFSFDHTPSPSLGRSLFSWNRRFVVAWFAVVGSGFGTLVYLVTSTPLSLDWVRLLVWMLLGHLVANLSLRTSVRSNTMDVTTVVVMAALFDPLLPNPLAAALVGLATITWRELAGCVPGWLVAMNRFGVVLYVTTAYLATELVARLYPHPGSTQVGLQVVAAALAFVAANIVFLIVPSAMRRALTLRDTFSRGTLYVMASDLVLTCLGWVAAQVAVALGQVGALPIIAEGLFLRSLLSVELALVQRTDDLGGAQAVNAIADVLLEVTDPAEAIDRVLAQATDYLGSAGTAVVLYGPPVAAHVSLGLDAQASVQVAQSLQPGFALTPHETLQQTLPGLGLPGWHAALSSGEAVIGCVSTYTTSVVGLTPAKAAALQTCARMLALAYEKAALHHQITEMALHDQLTHLPNRRLLQDRFAQALRLARRSSGHVSFILMDLNKFKPLNDTLGHAAGDELLVKMGPRIRTQLRDSDTLARLGGDEFAILLPGADTEGASRVARNVLTAIELPFEISGHTVHVGSAMGIATYPEHGEDDETLRRRADTAMYTAKRTQSGFSVATPDAV